MTMGFQEACEQLNKWIDQSDGRPIPMSSGVHYAFTLNKRYDAVEIASFEQRLQIQLPQDYSEFLIRVGAGRYFIDAYGLGFVFHLLEALAEHSAEVFAGLTDQYPRLLLTVSLTGRGDEGGFVVTRSAFANFAVFSHEEDPEHWASEALTWSTFSRWLARLVASEGEDDLP